MSNLRKLTLLCSLAAASCQDDRFYIDTEYPGTIRSRQDMRLILEGFSLLISLYEDGVLYAHGSHVSETVRTSVGYVMVRLWFYSMRGNRLLCQLNPDNNDLMLGSEVRAGFTLLLQTLRSPMIFRQAAYAFANSAGGLFGVEYYLYDYVPPDTPALQQPEARPQEGDAGCNGWLNGLVSGFKDMPRTVLYAGQSAFSQTAAYGLHVGEGSDCVVRLTSKTGQLKWSSDTSVQGNNCRLRLQEDGNLVLLDENEKGVWATNVYCSPQPDCSWSVFLAVQDDCNVVIYPTGEHGEVTGAIWASGCSDV